jgi:hypothetical protein
MRHFKALRIRTKFARTEFAISIILGFALVTFGCATGGSSNGFTKDKSDAISDLTVIAKGSSEGIYLYLGNIPQNAQYLSVSLYDITANDNLYTGTNFHGNDLEQIRNTNILLCPFVKSGHEYEITVIAYIQTKENLRPINNGTITAIANGGIHIINNPILNWNNSDNIATLSVRPVFSDVTINSQNTELIYGLVFNNKEISGKVGELTNELVFDNTENFNSIIKMIGNIGLSGDIPIFADVTLSIEYENIKWKIVFAKTKEIIYSL